MQSKAATVDEYLAELPEDRRAAIGTIRQTILDSLPDGYEERMQYGMIGYVVPHSLYPAGYHCDPKQPLAFVCLASQKNYMSLYLGCVYCDAEYQEWFTKSWLATGRKLDMGKSCVRFRKLDDVPLDLLSDALRRVPPERFISAYEAGLNAPRPARKNAVKKAASKKKAAKRKSPGSRDV